MSEEITMSERERVRFADEAAEDADQLGRQATIPGPFGSLARAVLRLEERFKGHGRALEQLSAELEGLQIIKDGNAWELGQPVRFEAAPAAEPTRIEGEEYRIIRRALDLFATTSDFNHHTRSWAKHTLANLPEGGQIVVHPPRDQGGEANASPDPESVRISVNRGHVAVPAPESTGELRCPGADGVRRLDEAAPRPAATPEGAGPGDREGVVGPAVEVAPDSIPTAPARTPSSPSATTCEGCASPELCRREDRCAFGGRLLAAPSEQESGREVGMDGAQSVRPIFGDVHAGG